MQSLALFAIALTNVHVGAGRAPSVVDLPVIRDSLGVPFIPASSIKGALKTLCGYRKSCIDKDEGIIKCDDCGDCCCLFGPEAGKGDEGSSALSILDGVLMAIPVASASEGYVYITSPLLLERCSMVFEALGYNDLARSIENLARVGIDKYISIDGGVASSSNLTSGSTIRIDVAGTGYDLELVTSIDSEAKELLNKLSKLGGLASSIMSKLAILSDAHAIHVIEKALLRVTRVRLRRDTKTVAHGALWTEEYIPIGTIFVLGMVETPMRNKYCEGIDNPVNKLIEILGLGNGITYITIGGKESIGKGILKLLKP